MHFSIIATAILLGTLPVTLAKSTKGNCPPGQRPKSSWDYSFGTCNLDLIGKDPTAEKLCDTFRQEAIANKIDGSHVTYEADLSGESYGCVWDKYAFYNALATNWRNACLKVAGPQPDFHSINPTYICVDASAPQQ